jgi:hypothetical protein
MAHSLDPPGSCDATTPLWPLGVLRYQGLLEPGRLLRPALGQQPRVRARRGAIIESFGPRCPAVSERERHFFGSHPRSPLRYFDCLALSQLSRDYDPPRHYLDKPPSNNTVAISITQ